MYRPWKKPLKNWPSAAVNLGSHQILIGSRSIREGDLLVLEYGRASIRCLGAKRRGERRLVLRHRFAKTYFKTVWIWAKRITEEFDLGNFGHR